MINQPQKSILIKTASKFSGHDILQRLFSQTNINYFLIIISIILGIYLNWEIINVLVFAFVIWLILYPLPSQVLAKVALALIILLPIMLIIKRGAAIDKYAVLVYAFLILAAISQFYEKTEKVAPSNKIQAKGTKNAQ